MGKKVPQIVELSKKTGVDEGHIVLGGIVVSSLLILIFMGGVILSVVATVVYPAYKSIKALESAGEDDDKIWLTYWCVFGVFSLVDEFGGIILSLIPFYYYIKIGLFLWMMHPATHGATTIYKTVLRPLLIKHRSRIDQFIAEVKGGAMSAAKEAAAQGMKELSKPENLMKAAQLSN